MTRLMGPARVIDVTDRCADDRDYELRPEDIYRHEERYGPVPAGAIVLIRTGFADFYPDAAKYLGSAARGSAEGLHFPGIGAEAARVLVARSIDAVGLDTASIDHGPSTHFGSHVTLCAANIPIFENVGRLSDLPAQGATVIALPMKIAGGSGGPLRIVAHLPLAD